MATKAVAQTPEPAPQREVIPGLEGVLSPAWPQALQFDSLGVTHTLTVTDAKVTQDRDYNDNSLKLWPSGEKLMILVVIGTDTDGLERSLWVKGARLTGAFRKALSHAGIVGIAKGDTVSVTFCDTEEVFDNKGKALKDPAKLYEVEITPVG